MNWFVAKESKNLALKRCDHPGRMMLRPAIFLPFVPFSGDTLKRVGGLDLGSALQLALADDRIDSTANQFFGFLSLVSCFCQRDVRIDAKCGELAFAV